jgi:hypothetical protein
MLHHIARLHQKRQQPVAYALGQIQGSADLRQACPIGLARQVLKHEQSPPGSGLVHLLLRISGTLFSD